MNKRAGRISQLRRSLGLPGQHDQQPAEPRRPAPLVVPPKAQLVAKPQRKADRIAELRRAISRIEGRHVDGSRARPASTAPQHPGYDSTPRPQQLPPATYLETYEARHHRFGRYPVCQPEALRQTLARLCELLPRACDPAPGRPLKTLRPDELLFIDTETTGLSRAAGTIAFLVGAGRFSRDGERYEVHQHLLREPGEEPQLLAALQPLFEHARVLVSFNGRGFDLPILRNRALVWRSPLALDRPHLDLLPLGRRVFGGRTSNCRLGTLEREVLGFVRGDDIDGAEAPERYLEFLHTGNAEPLEAVIEHNRLDVATMAPLFSLTVDHLADPLEWAEDAEELLSVGQLHLAWGHHELGEQCLKRGLDLARLPRTRDRLLIELAAVRRRQGDREGASRVWQRYVAEFPERDDGWIALAKHHEHTTKDLGQALQFAERAPRRQSEEVQHRISRLRRRIQRALDKSSHRRQAKGSA